MNQITSSFGMLQCGHDPKVVENSGIAVTKTKPDYKLQCGHDPKVVENPAELRQFQRIIGLQCGHDPKVVENARCTGETYTEIAASMRPRPEGRGEQHDPGRRKTRLQRFNAATTRRSWRTLCAALSIAVPWRASMRPRPEGRGEPHRTPSRAPAVPRLQCGHDPKVVENPFQYYLQNTAGMLQCGHDPKVVENDASRQWSARRARGFNAATTRRSWRTWPECGADHDNIGASMRPRPEGRGEPGALWPERGADHELQCGHDPKVVENGSPPAPTNPGLPSLQCGHDPKVVENVNSPFHTLAITL